MIEKKAALLNAATTLAADSDRLANTASGTNG
jgi:hypothetical protein